MTTGHLRVAIAGASGRMGHMLIEAVLAAPDLQLAGALDVAGSPALGQDAGSFDGANVAVHNAIAVAVLVTATTPLIMIADRRCHANGVIAGVDDRTIIFGRLGDE